MKKMPSSTRKFIRREKARIRRQFLDTKKQEELIKELYNIVCKNKSNENVKAGSAGEKVPA